MNESTTKIMSALMAAAILILVISPLAPLGAAEQESLLDVIGLTPHSTINVNNDITLAALISSNGWSGNGTEDNPFIIENLDIDAHGSTNAMFIGNTTMHLIVRGCHLYNTSVSLGEMPFDANCGAAIYNGQNVILENNNCSGNGRGIALFSSTAITVRNNSCFGNVHGIGVYTSNGNVLEGNTCSSDTSDGIHFETSVNNMIEKNRCYQNGRYGIVLTDSCNSNDFLSNQIFMNSNAGLKLSTDCNDNTIIGNELSNNLGYGVHIASSSNRNLVYGNDFFGNRGATTVYSTSCIQGYDDGSNLWNSTIYGNLWGDWAGPDSNGDGIVDAPYLLSGSSGSDKLPLAMTNVSISQPTEGAVVNTPTVIVTGVADPDYMLSINGALVYVEENGSFSYALSLLEGSTMIEVRSLNPLGSVSDFVNVTYVNDLRAELDEMSRRITALDQALSAAVEDLDSAIEGVESGLNQTDSTLNDTMVLLSQTRGWLQEVNNELTDCYADQNLTALEVASLIEQISELRSSLIDLRGSLNLTDEQAAVLAASLNVAIADLSSAEDQLEALQADMDEVQADQLPLILGAAGFILGLLTLFLFVLVYVRKIKLP